MTAKKEILADGPDYRLTLHRAHGPKAEENARIGGGPLVVTFGGAPSNLSEAGFGTGWCQARGWDTVYVAQRKGTQYQQLDQATFAAAMAPICQGRDVVCYGSSLGGYAALYFGGTIGSRIVAVSPMLPAWPPLGRSEVDIVPILHKPMEQGPFSPHSPVIIYDPIVSADQKMVEGMVLPAYPASRMIRLEFAGHTVLQMLARIGIINQVLTPLIAEDKIIDFEVNTDNPIWHFQKGRHLLHTAPEVARVHLERCLELEPSRHVAGNLLVLLLRIGEREAAQALIDRIAAQNNAPGRGIAAPSLARAKAAGMDISAFEGAVSLE